MALITTISIILNIIFVLSYFIISNKNKVIDKKPLVDVDEAVIPQTALAVNPKTCRFYSHDKKTLLDESKYEKMVVYGKSLEPVGISHNDVIFIERIDYSRYISESDLVLPKVCVFRRDGVTKRNKSRYSTGYVMALYDYRSKENNDIDKILDKVFSLDKMKYFRDDPRYVSDEYVRNNFSLSDNLLNKNVSLYMKLNDDGLFNLECVESSAIFGYVRYCFSM